MAAFRPEERKRLSIKISGPQTSETSQLKFFLSSSTVIRKYRIIIDTLHECTKRVAQIAAKVRETFMIFVANSICVH